VVARVGCLDCMVVVKRELKSPSEEFVLDTRKPGKWDWPTCTIGGRSGFDVSRSVVALDKGCPGKSSTLILSSSSFDMTDCDDLEV
jgi:hypothetical protein